MSPPHFNLANDGEAIAFLMVAIDVLPDPMAEQLQVGRSHLHCAAAAAKYSDSLKKSVSQRRPPIHKFVKTTQVDFTTALFCDFLTQNT